MFVCAATVFLASVRRFAKRMMSTRTPAKTAVLSLDRAGRLSLSRWVAATKRHNGMLLTRQPSTMIRERGVLSSSSVCSIANVILFGVTHLLVLWGNSYLIVSMGVSSAGSSEP